MSHAVSNIGGTEKPVIRPQNPVEPSTPSESKGAVPNVGSGTEQPVVRGGTQS